jgi:chromosome segregation ATPase
MPIFSNDPEDTIKDLLSQLVSTKKKAMEVTKLAKKFYKVSEDAKKNSKDLITEITTLQEEVSNLLSTLNSQQKEIDLKDKRLDDIEHEMQVVEKDFRAVLHEVNVLRKENRILKETKPLPIIRQKTSLMKENEDYEEQNKRLKVEITDLEEDVERKVKEIESLNTKIKEILVFANNERTSAEKARMVSSSLKAELEEANEKADDMELFYESEKTKSYQLEQEVIKLKNYIDFLVREYEKERNTFASSQRRLSIESRGPVEDDFLKNEPFEAEIESSFQQRSRRNTRRTETLADYMKEEDEEYPKAEIKSKTYFMLTSPTPNSFHLNERDSSRFSIETFPCQTCFALKDENSNEISGFNGCRKMSFSVETAESLTKTRRKSDDLKVAGFPVIFIPASYPAVHPSSVTLASRLNKQEQQDFMRVYFILVFNK